LKRNQFSRVPEIGLSFWSFFLNFSWEVIQTYFYTLRDSPFVTMLYGWFHCTLGDVIITLGSFWLISMMSHNRRWFLNLKRLNFIVFVLVGLVYTVFSEWANVHILKSWNYNQLMPIIPWIKVGLTPFFQWLVVPSVAILLVRHHLLLHQEVAKRKET
jgi:hypothetical protein